MLFHLLLLFVFLQEGFVNFTETVLRFREIHETLSSL